MPIPGGSASAHGFVAVPITNPWLAEPTLKRQLERSALEGRILILFSTHNMCVLATAGTDGPLATPVRYFHLGFSIMFTASPRSPKMRNIANDPRVSIGIHAPLVGLAGSRGAQVFGHAVVVPSDHHDFGSYWEAFRWESEKIE